MCRRRRLVLSALMRWRSAPGSRADAHCRGALYSDHRLLGDALRRSLPHRSPYSFAFRRPGGLGQSYRRRHSSQSERIAQSLDGERLMECLHYPRAEGYSLINPTTRTEPYDSTQSLAGLSISLSPHSLHHTADSTGIRVHDSHQFFDSEVAVSSELRGQLLSFGRQSLKRDVRRHHNVGSDRKIDTGQRLRRLVSDDLANSALLIEG
jgi:hypothetical protein